MGAITGFAQGISTKQVFGDPVHRGRTTLLPVAKIAGGGGGDGSGGGYGGAAKPLGVFVLDDSGVRWRPAVDPAAIGAAGGIVLGIAALLLARAAHRRCCRARQDEPERRSPDRTRQGLSAGTNGRPPRAGRRRRWRH